MAAEEVGGPLPPIPDTAAARQPAIEAALAALKAADPGFDLATFLELVHRRFLAVKAALQKRAPETLGGVVNPALVEGWRTQANSQIVAGVRTEIRDLEAETPRLVWLTVGPVRDRATLAVDYLGSPTGVDDATGAVVFGGQQVDSTEYWTLSRPSGTTTAAPGADSAQCPTCGAPVSAERGASCPYCGGALPDALLGWVLERVDDSIDWAPES